MKRKVAHLRFSGLEAASAYLKSLGPGEYRTTGNWTLDHIYKHCAIAIECSLAGFPKHYPLLIRRTLGRWSYLAIRALRFFPPHVPNVRAIPAPEDSGGSAESYERLLLAVERLTAHAGEWAEHPFFGRLGAEDWRTLHSWHLANHLSYVVVRQPGAVLDPLFSR